VLRIFPLYVVVLTGSWALAGTGWVVPLDTTELIRHLTLIQGKDIFWSVPVEFKYYFAIPLVALAVAGLRSWRREAAEPLALCLLATVAAVSLLLWPPAQSPVNSDRLVDYLSIFLCGSAAAVVAPSSRAFRPVALQGLALVLLLSVALLAPASLRAVGFDVRNDVMHRSFLLFGLLWSGVLLCIRHSDGPLTRLFAWRPLRACGQWSFGIYLLHMSAVLPLQQRDSMDPSLRAWLALGTSLFVAAMAFKVIERPCIRFGSQV
jgi:peptidoglycan/LPS O-acetylase OafA/YrhL